MVLRKLTAFVSMFFGNCTECCSFGGWHDFVMIVDVDYTKRTRSDSGA